MSDKPTAVSPAHEHTPWSRRMAVLVAGLGLCTSLWAGTRFRPIGDDEITYSTLARNLAAGRGLSIATAEPYEPSALRAPAYPMFLAAIFSLAGESDTAVLVTQSLILAAAWGLLTVQATLLFTRRAGLLAGLATAANPYLCRWSGARLSEALFMLLIVACVLALTWGVDRGRHRAFAVAGLLWGLATLCRPATVTLLPFLGLALALNRSSVQNRARAIAVLCLAGGAVLAPWTLRNWLHFGTVIPLQVHAAGANFWLTTIPVSDQPRHGWMSVRDSWNAKYPEMATYQAAGESTLDRQAAERMLASAGIRRVASDPLRWLRARLLDLPRLWIHSGRLWYGEITFQDAWRSRDLTALGVKALSLAFFSLMPLGLAALCIYRWSSRWQHLLPAIAVPASLAVGYLPLWVEDRYGMPAVPFFLVLAGGALAGSQRPLAMARRVEVKHDSVSVVIPSRNEGALALETARCVRERAGDGIREIIIADGRSTDGSPDLLRGAGFFVVTDQGGGKGVGLRAGLAAATQDIVVFMDADGSHDARDISSLVRPILEGQADLVIGCRMRGGSDEFAGSWALFIRLWGNNFLTLLLNSRFGVQLTDSQNGFRAARREVLNRLNLAERKHTIELEMVMKALKLGYRVTQVPSHEYSRKSGSSSLSILQQAPLFLRCLLGNIW